MPSDDLILVFQLAAHRGQAERVVQMGRAAPALLNALWDEKPSRPWEGTRPLPSAAAAGNLAMIELLLSLGAQLESVNGLDQTALFCAAERGHLAAVRLLLARGANVRHRSQYSGGPLHAAARSGDPAMVREVILAGADSSARDARGETPLHEAISRYLWPKPDPSEADRLEVIRLLLAAGVSVDAHTHDGETALHLAAAAGLPAETDLLLHRRAPVDALDVWQRTPLADAIDCHHPAEAAESCGHVAVASLLLARGANPNRHLFHRDFSSANRHAATDDGTLLQVAERRGHATVAQMLVRHGAAV